MFCCIFYLYLFYCLATLSAMKSVLSIKCIIFCCYLPLSEIHNHALPLASPVDRVFRPDPGPMSTLQKSVSSKQSLEQAEGNTSLRKPLIVCFQLLNWSSLPEEAEPFVFPALHPIGLLHCRTYGEACDASNVIML